MRVLVTGSRTWRGHEPIHAALDELHAAHPGMTLIHGACAQGADGIADRWATLRGLPVGQVERYPAEWRRYGRAAGPRRNAAMIATRPDLVLAFVGPCRNPECDKPRPHGSHGATHCADLAEQAGIPVRRWEIP